MNQHSNRIYWAPRLEKRKLARLYLSDAQGLLDEDLLDDVGITLYLRCESILDVMEAREGRVKCHECKTIFHHDSRNALLECPKCGWKVQLSDFVKSYKNKQLFAGAAIEFFKKFAAIYPSLKTPKEKLLAIDRLIHEFHYYGKEAGRTTGCNLIEGNHNDIIGFLDALSNSGGSDELKSIYDEWRTKAHLWNRGSLISSF